MASRRLRRIDAVRSLAATAVAAALRPAVAGAQGAPAHVRLASTANDDATPALYAIAKGWFRNAGLDIDLQAATNGAAVATAVAGGVVDIGRSNVVPLIAAHARGIPFTLVAPSGSYFDGVGSSGRIVVSKASPVQRARDLNGLTVSVASLNDIQTISARAWIDKDGGDSSSVKFVEATGQEAAIALDTGHIAAASLVSPLLGQLVQSGKYRVLGDPTAGIASRLMEAAWFSTTAYTDKYDLTLVPGDIQPLIDAAARYNAIPKSFDAREFIDPNAL